MKHILLATLCTIAIFGCATNPNTVNAHLVKVGDVDNFEVNDLRGAKINGFLNLQAVIKNNSRSIGQLYYRCNFYDTNKFQVGNDPQWIPVRVYGKATQNISCTATEPTAVDFKLEISSSGDALKVYR